MYKGLIEWEEVFWDSSERGYYGYKEETVLQLIESLLEKAGTSEIISLEIKRVSKD